jgi:hypothetical protein
MLRKEKWDHSFIGRQENMFIFIVFFLVYQIIGQTN